jgi:hypothetical protein
MSAWQEISEAEPCGRIGATAVIEAPVEYVIWNARIAG